MCVDSLVTKEFKEELQAIDAMLEQANQRGSQAEAVWAFAQAMHTNGMLAKRSAAIVTDLMVQLDGVKLPSQG